MFALIVTVPYALGGLRQHPTLSALRSSTNLPRYARALPQDYRHYNFGSCRCINSILFDIDAPHCPALVVRRIAGQSVLPQTCSV